MGDGDGLGVSSPDSLTSDLQRRWGGGNGLNSKVESPVGALSIVVHGRD